MNTTKSGFNLYSDANVLRFINLDESVSLSQDDRLEFIHKLKTAINYKTVYLKEEVRNSIGDIPFPELKASISDECLSLAIDWRNAMLAKIEAAVDSYERKIGAAFYEANKDFGITGTFTMSKGKLKGYNSKLGNWNGFRYADVNSAIETVDALLPKYDYAINNPNNGNDMHEWQTTGEYIFACFKYVKQKELDRINEAWSKIETVFQNAKADSTRVHVEELGHGAFEVTLVFWWD